MAHFKAYIQLCTVYAQKTDLAWTDQSVFLQVVGELTGTPGARSAGSNVLKQQQGSGRMKRKSKTVGKESSQLASYEILKAQTWKVMERKKWMKKAMYQKTDRIY